MFDAIAETFANVVRTLLTTRTGLLTTGTVSLTLFCLLSVASWLLGEAELQRYVPFDVKIARVALAVVGIAALTLRYLQSGGNSEGKSDQELYTASFVRETNTRLKRVEERAEFHDDFLSSTINDLMWNQEERAKAVESVEKRLTKATLEEVFANQTASLKEQLARSASLEELRITTEKTLLRLRREIDDLRLRANANMIVGIAITGVGFLLLWNAVTSVGASPALQKLASTNAESNWQFAKTFILSSVPRITLVIFIEIFAYFFLRLYANGLTEIKYFQNEMTNVESKLISVEFALISQNTKSIEVALEALAKTERNFILEKGQTTVELERAKSESDLTRNVLKALPELFKKSDSK